ncbi:hypothetical protein [Roseibium sp.]|uniref:hypothetical protein n=1 Tax=Roseibium sp. TaxID=1936156 RepID=UPI003264158E
MSFRKWLGFDGPVNHGVPTVNTPYELWNTYTVITSVREPLDRAVSCYRFLTHDSYTGIFKKVYPDLGGWDPLTFFRTIINEQLFVLAGQYKYAEHFQSNKKPDFLFKFENMDTSELGARLGIAEPLPRANTGKNKSPVQLSEDLYLSLVEHFKVDYLLFNYRPKPYSAFMERQEKLAA